MRLIDAEKIEEFASHYTEFDGEPLTEREKDLVENVCKKISTQMPTAYDLDKVIRRLRKEFYCSECVEDIRERGIKRTCSYCGTHTIIEILRGGQQA